MRKIMTKFRGLWFLAIAALVMAVCAVAVAENDKEVRTTLEQRMQKKISVDFRNTPIEDVIRIMADQADVDIVKSPKVVGDVTATLTNVPLEEALNNILAAHGYGYTATKNMIRIAPIEEITAVSERIDHKIYTITYADVKEVEAALNKFISKAGVVSSNPGTSNIIVTDTESKIKKITEFIEVIDRITPQVLVEARIYDISSTDEFDLGVEWSLGSNTNYGTGGPGSVGTNPTDRTEPFITGTFGSGINKAETTTGLIRFGILNSSIDIDALISAEQEKVCAKLLASPRVLVLDNETATFEIIEERPYQELTQAMGGGNIGTTQFKEIGIKLEVTPHIARDGMVRLHLQPEFSTVIGTVSLPLPGTTQTGPQPIVATRKTDTKVLVHDGQTVVLAGLRKKNVEQEWSKVPLLGDMPLLGILFKFEGEKTVNSELVVFVTPTIVIEPAMTGSEKWYFEATETEMCPPECPPTKIDPCFE